MEDGASRAGRGITNSAHRTAISRKDDRGLAVDRVFEPLLAGMRDPLSLANIIAELTPVPFIGSLTYNISSLTSTLEEIQERAQYYSQLKRVIAFIKYWTIKSEVQHLFGKLDSCLIEFFYIADASPQSQGPSDPQSPQLQEAGGTELAEGSVPWDEDFIGRETTLENAITSLAKHGCADLTTSINLDACSPFPVSGGGFCDVYRGKIYDGRSVAIKSLRVFDGPEMDAQRQKLLKRAAREVYQWSKLNHPNVMPLLGLAIFHGRLSMLSEWMDNGTLSTYLRLHPDTNRINMCVEICQGLLYIHDRGMIHGDLKAANVMVSSTGIALVTDFGSARLKDITLKFSNTTGVPISLRWAAPELLRDDNTSQLSKETDIWAYGIVYDVVKLQEVMTGTVPFSELNDNQVLMAVGMKNKSPSRPTENLDDGLWDIMKSCWASDPQKRPTINMISEYLSMFLGGNPLPLWVDHESYSGSRMEAIIPTNIPAFDLETPLDPAFAPDIPLTPDTIHLFRPLTPIGSRFDSIPLLPSNQELRSPGVNLEDGVYYIRCYRYDMEAMCPGPSNPDQRIVTSPVLELITSIDCKWKLNRLDQSNIYEIFNVQWKRFAGNDFNTGSSEEGSVIATEASSKWAIDHVEGTSFTIKHTEHDTYWRLTSSTDPPTIALRPASGKEHHWRFEPVEDLVQLSLPRLQL
ncbi:unnamed protein product [Rhizoctonia solani]|uniref:Protein kinase domain-containing protein n=1 Tax=Rhizoctonia solani TaxID=456999 RepID=A0A8H3GE74_9AGAM|nr:unnamed protein product [Rhizoctonia solani]